MHPKRLTTGVFKILERDWRQRESRLGSVVRPRNHAGHEHFGFQDGVSNPLIEGFQIPHDDEPTTKPGWYHPVGRRW